MPARKSSTASAVDTHVAAAVTAVEETMTAARESVEEAVRNGQETLAGKYEEVVTMSKGQMDDMTSRWFTNYGEFSAFQKANLEALVAATTTAIKGSEAFSRKAYDFTKTSMDQSVDAAKALMTVKSAQEALDLQSNLAKSTFDSTVVEAGKVSEMAVQLANDVAAPIQQRLNAAMESFTRAA